MVPRKRPAVHTTPVVTTPPPAAIQTVPVPSTPATARASSKGWSFPWLVLILIPLALAAALLLLSARRRRGQDAAERKRLKEQRRLMRKGPPRPTSPPSKEAEPDTQVDGDPDATFARSYVEWLEDR